MWTDVSGGRSSQFLSGFYIQPKREHERLETEKKKIILELLLDAWAATNIPQKQWESSEVHVRTRGLWWCWNPPFSSQQSLMEDAPEAKLWPLGDSIRILKVGVNEPLPIYSTHPALRIEKPVCVMATQLIIRKTKRPSVSISGLGGEKAHVNCLP